MPRHQIALLALKVLAKTACENSQITENPINLGYLQTHLPRRNKIYFKDTLQPEAASYYLVFQEPCLLRIQEQSLGPAFSVQMEGINVNCGQTSMQKKPANSSDYPSVAICFRDIQIAYLFAELIEAEGHSTQIVEDTESLRDETHIVTESSLLDYLSLKDTANCLVIGDQINRLPKDVVPLVRPLSEDKINRALHEFLPKK